MEREVVNDFDTMDTINFFHTLIFGPLNVVETKGCRECPNGAGARFSKAPESFRARKANFKSSVSKNGEVCTLETSCMKGTSLHLKNMGLKQLCTRKVRVTGPKSFRGFRETAPGVREGGENSLSDSSYFILYVQVPLGIFTFILPTRL